MYHESVQVYGKDVDIAGQPGDTVVLDGARRLTGWQRSASGWYVDGWTLDLARTSGDMIDRANPMAAYPDLAFMDGAPLRQVASISDLSAAPSTSTRPPTGSTSGATRPAAASRPATCAGPSTSTGPTARASPV